VTSTVYVLNGPNLNLLGRRDPAVYGTATLADVERLCTEEADRLGLALVFRQSNHEGQLIDWIHEAFEAGAAVVGNFGGYTHTSIAIMDALAVVEAPVVEVHISDIHAREEFRHRSYVSLVADDAVIGLGVEGYALALRRVARLLAPPPPGSGAEGS
jgi:3-dehydroquinate dehydratase-2